LAEIKKKIFKKKYSLQITILTLFASIAAIFLAIVGSQLFYVDRKLSLETINMKTSNIVQSIQNSIKESESTHLQTVSLMNKIAPDRGMDFYIDILKTQKALYAAYTGYGDGSFYEIINLDIDEELRKNYNASNEDRWLLIIIDGSHIEKRELFLYDKELNLRSQRVEDNSYDATSRPWYKMALKDEKVIKTLPYKFSHIDAYGVTYSQKLKDSNNVVSIDVLLKDFKNLYKDYLDADGMEMYMFQNGKEIKPYIATNQDIFQRFIELNLDLNELNEPKIIEIGGEKFITQAILIDGYFENEYMLFLANYEKTINPYNQKTYKLILSFILTSLLMAPLVLYFSKIVVRPIFRLAIESEKIKNREYDVVEVKSFIKEVSILSSVFSAMSESVKNHQEYLEETVKKRTKELNLKNEELYKNSITDKLTNIYNRAKLDLALSEEIDRSKRYGSIFSIILIDVDFFKKVNDNYGHQVGDDVLKQSAKVLLENIRQTDLLGRWGGEEFLIICTQTDKESVLVLAEKLRKTIKSHKYPTYPKEVTISLGVATYSEKIKSIDDILLSADRALYDAKNQGRDRVVAS